MREIRPGPRRHSGGFLIEIKSHSLSKIGVEKREKMYFLYLNFF